MALEPLEPTASGTEDDSELRDMTKRFWISLILTLPVFLIAMAEMIPGNPLPKLASPRILTWLQFGLATPVVIERSLGSWARATV